jgi:hypothetical protein
MLPCPALLEQILLKFTAQTLSAQSCCQFQFPCPIEASTGTYLASVIGPNAVPKLVCLLCLFSAFHAIQESLETMEIGYEVRCQLDRNGLGKYATFLIDQGWDTPEVLAGLSADEIAEIAEGAEMVPGHKRKFTTQEAAAELAETATTTMAVTQTRRSTSLKLPPIWKQS